MILRKINYFYNHNLPFCLFIVMLIDVFCKVGTAFVDIHCKLKRTHLMWKLQTPVRPRPNFNTVKTGVFLVTTGDVRINITSKPLLPWKSNKYYVFRVRVCSLSYPTRKAHAPYFLLWPVWLYHNVSHYLTNSTTFGIKVIEHKMCVLIFCVGFLKLFSFQIEFNEVLS
jgi:hypothetical protein